MPIDLSAEEARQLALLGHGFTHAPGNLSPEKPSTSKTAPGKPTANTTNPTRAQVFKTIRRLNGLQIDSVNVLARAHLLPVFSRLGPHDLSHIETLATDKNRRLFEYWGHEASLLPVEDFPLYRWRMQDAREGKHTWGGIKKIRQQAPKLLADIRHRIEQEGPLAASDLQSGPRKNKASSGGWWGWSETKTALEALFWGGELLSTHRRTNFERVYDLPERVVGEQAHAPAPNRATAQRQLIAQAIQLLGVATETDLRKHLRLPADDAKKRIQEMHALGTLTPGRVHTNTDGKTIPVWLAPKRPRRHASLTDAPTALIVPFDPLMWERDRLERLFGFHYRIEIYVPKDKRVFGYYVLPFLYNGQFVARVDLKADRPRKTLLVQHAHLEPRFDTKKHKHPIAESLLAHLTQLAHHLDLEHTHIAPTTDFAQTLMRLN